VFLSVKDLELRDIEFSVVVPAGVDELDHHWRQAGPLEASGRAELASATLEEIRVQGHLHAGLEGDCDRCLEPIGLVVDTPFDVNYRPARFANPDAGEVEIAKSESDIAFYDGEGIELDEVLREQMMLSLPMQRLCRKDCRGICPVCGQNRNLADCDCHVKPADDRWAALKQI
jgi:uncharacterized protein